MGIISTMVGSAPLRSGPLVHRPRLHGLLDAVDRSRVTLVHAPAGYGKTTILRAWADELRLRGRPVLWLAARGGMERVEDFRSGLWMAATRSGLDWPPCPPDGSVEDLLARLIGDGARRPVLILDDAHLLPVETQALVERMVITMRDAMTTIVAARGRNRVPVARLRSLGMLVELGERELRFTGEEIAAWVVAHGETDGASLLTRTDGWAAGLVMAQRLTGMEGAKRWTHFARDVGDYFTEEVLAGIDPAIATFLTDTAILDSLTPAACQALTGREDSRRLLADIEAAGLFLALADIDAGRYVLHPLFRQLMLRRLTEETPAHAAELRRRAGRYFMSIQESLPAIAHAQASGDLDFLADCLDAMAETATYAGHLLQLDSIAGALSWPQLEGRPSLLLLLAWRRIRGLAFTPAQKLIDAAAACIEAQGQAGTLAPHQLVHLRRLVEHRSIILAAARDDMAEVETRAQVLLAELGDDYPYLSCTMLAQLMAARRELYHFRDILKLEAETRRALELPGVRFASIALKSSVAPTFMVQGKVEAARALLREALEIAEDFAGKGSPLAALPALPLAELLYDCGDLAGADDLVKRHLGVARQLGFLDQLAAGYLVRARLLAARGQIDAALTALEGAHLVAIECGLDRLRAYVVAEQVRLLLRDGQPQKAAAAFEAGDLSLDDEPLPTMNPTRRQESIAIAWLRLEIHGHRLVRARKVAKRWSAFVRRAGALRSAVAFELLLAQIALLEGDRQEARRAVREAVTLAAPAGWTRIFLDEGEAVGTLLVDAYGHGPVMDTPVDRFAARLASSFTGIIPFLEMEDEEEGDSQPSSRLSPRELEVLGMVGAGLRNKEIGNRLGLTEGTVKWYMQQVYDKLGVRRRPQTVIKARQLGLMV
ncbi:LuxR C-terminal-related transcriptional regulator [Niveispirillum sp. KHB5.9]|uniref:LuxR C-terminal-related transcriptional regulator n=1 Tax=Niveispirillum sp. KHB5.9 TaxID=3400269 RepID=UPI003A8917F7